MALEPTDDKEETEQLKRRSFLASSLFGALLAICFAGTLETLGAGVPDTPMMIALTFFAVGLPLNSLMVFTTLHGDLFVRLGDSGRYRSVFLICAFSPVLGMTCIFAHFSIYVALVFVASAVFSMYLLNRWTTAFIGKSAVPYPDHSDGPPPVP